MLYIFIDEKINIDAFSGLICKPNLTSIRETRKSVAFGEKDFGKYKQRSNLLPFKNLVILQQIRMLQSVLQETGFIEFLST